MQVRTSLWTIIKRQPRWRLVLLGVFCAGTALWFASREQSAAKLPTFTARRGPLDVVVLESGSLHALQYQEVKCEVRVGYQGTKILKIVEEGYLVTEEDLKEGKVLVELDSSELQKQITQQEIQFQAAGAALTDAEQNYEIQLSQNESDIKAAEQKARFARMDFEKFVGDAVTDRILAESGLDKLLAVVSTNNIETIRRERTASTPEPNPELLPTGASAGPAVQVAKMSSIPAGMLEADLKLDDSSSGESRERSLELPRLRLIDFSKYASIEIVGDGEAKQKLRKFEDDLQVARKELGQATTALEGTRRLFEKGFVPKTEITRDEISFESARLKVQTAETAQALFLRYEFPKAGEEALSRYAEAVRELEKARRVAISKLAQARSRLNSARGQYEVQLRQRKDLQDQLEKCTLRAQKSGLVVYGANRDDMVYYGGQEPIREGATVRERQTIITIPDMTRMAVNVKIHESYIKKVKKGQKARVTVDAFPDEVLTGEITKVGVLPDSQNRWMSPDLKVYLTTIAIDGTHEWTKPGMSAKVEILVNRLEDVVYVPVQAVFPESGKQFCYVMRGLKPERREVTIGEFTDDFIEIKSGVREGERVLLRPPGADAPQPNSPKQKSPESDSTPEKSAPAGSSAETARLQ